MIERDLVQTQKAFREIVGFRAIAEISDEGAFVSAGVIVDLEERILTHETQPIDLFRSLICASQLIKRWDIRHKQYTDGSIASVRHTGWLDEISARFSRGNLDTDEIKELTAWKYVADPPLGAGKAMDIVEQLRQLYPDYPLREMIGK